MCPVSLHQPCTGKAVTTLEMEFTYGIGVLVEPGVSVLHHRLDEAAGDGIHVEGVGVATAQPQRAVAHHEGRLLHPPWQRLGEHLCSITVFSAVPLRIPCEVKSMHMHCQGRREWVRPLPATERRGTQGEEGVVLQVHLVHKSILPRQSLAPPVRPPHTPPPFLHQSGPPHPSPIPPLSPKHAPQRQVKVTGGDRCL